VDTNALAANFDNSSSNACAHSEVIAKNGCDCIVDTDEAIDNQSRIRLTFGCLIAY